MSKKVTHLYSQFQPDHYELLLVPNSGTMTFTGTVTITGQKTGRPSQRLTFHQKDLKVTRCTIIKHDKKGDQTFSPTRVNNQNSFDEVRLHCDSMLYPGKYSVTMEFEGKITRPMNGIYPCNFEHDGQEKMLIATQFESHHAREAFPCIDEPEAKATFDLSLVTPIGQTVVANTPVQQQDIDNDSLTTVFETTPRMSTYLLAFVYGEMGYLEATTKDGVLVRAYATPDNVDFTKFALDTAVKCLEFYNDYFDIPYPLQKCDFIALPDFASGAMENWGCITFREQALLVDHANTSLPMKQYVANVVAHELTHQWFGNLVTMRWWNDLWLNESFASWMSYLAIDHLHPDWEVWTQFIVDEQSAALRLDALANTHPIEVAINHPDEIRTIFDAISYEKGASVLHMLRNYLGDTTFRDGVRHYLKTHTYSNAITTDLWEAFEAVSDKPVRVFMETWTGQPGYPIIKASVDADELLTYQERFYLNPAADAQPLVWPTPLLANYPLAQDITDEPSMTVALPPAKKPLLINSQRTGFYRVIYNPTHQDEIAAAILEGQLDPLDRLGVLGDAFEAAKAGYHDTTSVLKLLEAYRNEDNTFVWDIMASVLGSLLAVMRDEELREAMKPYSRALSQAQVSRLGWDATASDTSFDVLLRPTVLGIASAADNPEVVAEAQKRFAKMTKAEDAHPDIRGVIYGTAARTGSAAEFDKLLDLHNRSKNSEERVSLAAALTSFKQPELTERALGMIMGKDVRLQDAVYWIIYSFMNRHARDTTWDWMVAHWDWLQANMGDDLGFYRMPLYAGRNYSDRQFLDTFQTFFEKHMSVAFERPVKQAVETIEWQSAWRERDLGAIKAYFKLK